MVSSSSSPGISPTRKLVGVKIKPSVSYGYVFPKKYLLTSKILVSRLRVLFPLGPLISKLSLLIEIVCIYDNYKL